MHEYVVVYNFRGGTGRSFVVLPVHMDSIEICRGVELDIEKNGGGIQNVTISWFKHLRTVA